MKHAEPSRLVASYGRHWRRDEVEWKLGSNSRWQMLGRINSNRPGLRLCDFRLARGVYVLEHRGRPSYVGIARGQDGFGSRLARHNRDEAKSWTTFSWFSFDAVRDEGTKSHPIPAGWAWIHDRDTVKSSSTESSIKEIEGLLVGLLGQNLTNVQTPKLPGADEWTQVTGSNFGPGGICQRVEVSGFDGRFPQ